MIKKDINICNNELIENKFAYRVFKDRALRNGNIIAFKSPVEIYKNNNIFYSDEAVNFLYEIPDISIITGICIQRLFNSIIGNILSNEKYLNAKVEIDENKILIHREHKHNGITLPYGIVNLNSLSFVNNTCIGYTAIHIKAGEKALAGSFSTGEIINENSIIQFMNEIIHEYYGLMQSLFLESSRI